MIRKNSRLKTLPSHFFNYLGVTYQSYAAAAIRRQSDGRDDVVSLKRLLTELKKYPHLVSRSYYRSLFNSSNISPDVPDRDFDKLVGKRKAELDPKRIEREIAELDRRTELIQHYVNKMIAHTADKGLKKAPPKLRDLDNCLRWFEKIIKRYTILLTAVSLTRLLPTFQYDWNEIFTIPWSTVRKRPSDDHN